MQEIGILSHIGFTCQVCMLDSCMWLWIACCNRVVLNVCTWQVQMHIFHAVEPQGLDGVILPKNLERQFSDAFGMWFREQLKRCVHMRFPQATPTIHCLSVYIYILIYDTHIVFTYVYTYACVCEFIFTHTHTHALAYTRQSHLRSCSFDDNASVCPYPLTLTLAWSEVLRHELSSDTFCLMELNSL